MDEIITHYIDVTYTPELKALLFRALGVIGVFQIPGPIVELSEHLLRDQDISKEQMSDGVIEIIERGLGQVFLAHRIDVAEDLELSDAIQVLESIVGIEYLEDYSGLKNAISNPYDTPRMVLIKMLAYMTERDEVDFEAMIDDVYEVTVDRMRTFVTNAIQQEENSEDVALLRKLRNNLVTYTHAFGQPAIAIALGEMEFELGWEFDTYLNLIKEEVVDYDDMESTAFGLFWLAIVSKDGHENPQAFLTDRVSDWYGEYTDAAEFTRMVTTACARYNEVKAKMKTVQETASIPH